MLHHVATTGAKKLIELCVDDDSSDTVAAAIESLAVYAEGVPWGLDMIKQMDSIATAVLDGTLLCQEVVSDFDDWEDDDVKVVRILWLQTHLNLTAVCVLYPGPSL